MSAGWGIVKRADDHSGNALIHIAKETKQSFLKNSINFVPSQMSDGPRPLRRTPRLRRRIRRLSRCRRGIVREPPNRNGAVDMSLQRCSGKLMYLSMYNAFLFL